MAGSKTVYPVSGFSMRNTGDKDIVDKFNRIAERECKNNRTEAFRKLVNGYKERKGS